MKPAYWILILAIVGAAIGIGMFRFTSWAGVIIAVLLGVIAGLIVFAIKGRKTA